MKVGMRRLPLRRRLVSPSKNYLDQLKEQCSILEKLLQQNKENIPFPISPGVKITMQIYLETLEDARKTLQSLIDHLALLQARHEEAE